MRADLPLAVVLLAVALAAGHSPDGALSWRDHGPANHGGHFLGAAWDPSDPTGESWYVAAYGGGVYHTRDAGASFEPMGLEGPVSTVAVPWERPERVFAGTGRNVFGDMNGLDPVPSAGTGLYRSDDYGSTWQPTGFPQDGAPDLGYITHVVVSARGDSVLAATYRRVFYSIDGGDSWSEGDAKGPDQGASRTQHMDLIAHPRHFRVQYALFRDREARDPAAGGAEMYTTTFVLRSADGGARWDTLYAAGVRTAGRRVALAIAPSEPHIHWLTLYDQVPARFFRSTDYGASWTEMAFSDPADGAWHGTSYFAIHPWQSDTLLLPQLATYLPAMNALQVQSAMPAYPAQRISAPLIGDTPHDNSQTAIDGYVFYSINTANGRLLRTVHKYAAGQLVADALDPEDAPGLTVAHVADVCKHPRLEDTGADYRYTATTPESGALRSPSANAIDPAWMRVQPYQSGAANLVLCHPSDHDLTLMISGLDPRVYRSKGPVNGPDDWEPIPDLDGTHAHDLSGSLLTPDLVYAATEDGAFRSDDFGSTWTQVHSRLPYHIEASKADSRVIWTEDFLSRDGGQTWQELPREFDGNVYSHASDPSIVFTCNGPAVTRWDDWGMRPSVLAHSADLGGQACNDLIVFPQDSTWLWVATNTGLWETADGGDTWRNAQRGLPAVGINRLHLGDTQVVVATQGRGVWSVDLLDVEAHLTSTERLQAAMPDEPWILNNYPNPFRSRTTLDIEVRRSAYIRLDVYDVSGRKVTTLADRTMPMGRHRIIWNATGYASGMYLLRMSANGRHVHTRHVLLAQ